MAINMLQLPGYQVSNPIDFAPINNALDSNRQLAIANQQNALAQRRLGLAEKADARAGEMHGVQMAQARRQSELEEARMAAGRVQGIMQLPAEQRAVAWAQARKMPGFRDLPPEFDNFEFAAPQILNRAREYLSEKDQAQMALIRAQTGMTSAHADLYRAQAGDLRNKVLAPGGFKDPKQLYDVEEGIRKEYSSHAKPFFETRDAYSRIQQAASAPSPAGDLALIFNFMKMLDPGSVVREGEFATAQNAAGIPERVRNMWNRALTGERLGDDQRADFVRQAQGLYGRAERQYLVAQDQYRSLAERKGIDPRNVILDYSIPKSEGRMEPDAGRKADRLQAPTIASPQGPAPRASAEPIGATRNIGGRVFMKTPHGWVPR